MRVIEDEHEGLVRRQRAEQRGQALREPSRVFVVAAVQAEPANRRASAASHWHSSVVLP